MSLTRLTADMAVISKLSDSPAETAAVLKAKFDEASLALGEYLNNTLAPELDEALEALMLAIEGIDIPDIIDALDSSDAAAALSARQGAALKTLIDSKQAVISSGTAAPSGGSDGDLYIMY